MRRGAAGAGEEARRGGEEVPILPLGDGTDGTLRRAKQHVPLDPPAARAAVAIAFGVGGKSEIPADLQAYFKKMGKVAGKEHIADVATSAGIDIEELSCTRQVELVYEGLLSGDLKLV